MNCHTVKCSDCNTTKKVSPRSKSGLPKGWRTGFTVLGVPKPSIIICNECYNMDIIPTEK